MSRGLFQGFHIRTVSANGNQLAMDLLTAFMPPKPKGTPSPSLQKVFIVEDHPVFRQGLAQMVNSEADLTVCGEAADAETALASIAGLKPDLVLADITLPGKTGLELIKELRAAHPTLKLLVISMHDEALYANRVLRAGGDGYIMKQEAPEEIVHAIRDVLAGHIYVSEEVLDGAASRAQPGAQAKPRPLTELSDSELELLEALGTGKSNQEIARELHLNAKTVAAHLRRIRKKLGFNTANALIRYAVCWVETGGETRMLDEG